MCETQLPPCLLNHPELALAEEDVTALLHRLAYVLEIADKIATSDLFLDGDLDLPNALDDLALDLSVNIGLSPNTEGTGTSPWLIQTTWTDVWWQISPDEAEGLRAAAVANADRPLAPDDDAPDAVLAWLRAYGNELRDQIHRLSNSPTASDAVLCLCLIDLTLLDLARGIGRLSLRLRLAAHHRFSQA